MLIEPSPIDDVLGTRNVQITWPVASAAFWPLASAAGAVAAGSVYEKLQLAFGCVWIVIVASLPRPIGLVKEAMRGPPADDCVDVVGCC